MRSRYAQTPVSVNNLSKIFSNRPENSIFPFFRNATEGPFEFRWPLSMLWLLYN
jgi:hypothetical protein